MTVFSIRRLHARCFAALVVASTGSSLLAQQPSRSATGAPVVPLAMPMQMPAATPMPSAMPPLPASPAPMVLPAPAPTPVPVVPMPVNEVEPETDFPSMEAKPAPTQDDQPRDKPFRTAAKAPTVPPTPTAPTAT